MRTTIRSGKNGMRSAVLLGSLVAGVAGLCLLLAGCGTLDRAYTKQVRMTSQPVVTVTTNDVVTSNLVATNLVTTLVTNTVPVFETNIVFVPVTNLVAKPEAEATIQAAGSIVNTLLPGVGGLITLALGGLYHGYRQVRNRKVNEALIQGVETARAILETTPQGEAADTAFVKWLMTHQKEAGVFTTVSLLVDSLSDNPAAKLTAQEILERVQRAQPAT